jgi:hypothetical protein
LSVVRGQRDDGDDTWERFELDQRYRWIGGASGLISLGMAAVAAQWFANGEVTARVGVTALVLFGGVGLGGLIVALFAGGDPVELGAAGVRPRRGPTTAWSDIVELRVRPLAGRIELLDRSGEVFAKLEYQLAELERALRILLASGSAAIQPFSQASTFDAVSTRRLAALFAALTAMVVLVHLLMGEPPMGSSFVIFVFFAWTLWRNHRRGYRVVLREADLVVHDTTREEVIPYAALSHVQLVRGALSPLSVRSVLPDGRTRTYPVRDPVSLWLALQVRLAR